MRWLDDDGGVVVGGGLGRGRSTGADGGRAALEVGIFLP
jgi:hypothetical protein